MKPSLIVLILSSFGVLFGCSNSNSPISPTGTTTSSSLENKNAPEKSTNENKLVIERVPDMENAISAMGTFDQIFAFRFQGGPLEGWVQVETDTGIEKKSVEIPRFKDRDNPGPTRGAIVIALRKSSDDPLKRECVVGLHVGGEFHAVGPKGWATSNLGFKGTVPMPRANEISGPKMSRSHGDPWTHRYSWKDGEEDWELFRLWQTIKEPTP